MTVIAATKGISANTLTVIYIIVTIVLAIAIPLASFFFRQAGASLKENTDATNRLATQVTRLEEKSSEHDRQLHEQEQQLRQHDRSLERLSGRLGYGR